MKHHKKLVIVFCLLAFIISIQAQSTIPAGGGDANGVDGSTSYSIGQMVYTTNTGTNGSVAEGVQQPYEISVIVGFEQDGFTGVNFTVYPNPATDLLILETDFSSYKNLTYQLFDIKGSLLFSDRLTDFRTTISMGNLAPSTYYLKVFDNQMKSKTFKIVKTK